MTHFLIIQTLTYKQPKWQFLLVVYTVNETVNLEEYLTERPLQIIIEILKKAWLNCIISAVQCESFDWYFFNSCIILKTSVFRKMCMCIWLLPDYTSHNIHMKVKVSKITHFFFEEALCFQLYWRIYIQIHLYTYIQRKLNILLTKPARSSFYLPHMHIN